MVGISLYTIVQCLIRPFRPINVYYAAQRLSFVSKFLGIDVEVRIPESVKGKGPFVFIGNHQNSYDLFTVTHAVQPLTVSIGKKSLKWIPFFGQMYWLTGNILIDRENSSKAMNTIGTAAKKIREKGISVWLFPEGTRSYGRGVLKFKTGAFRTALQAQVPMVPVCISNTHELIKLNRWNNGKVIIELLEPIDLQAEDHEHVRTLADDVREKMTQKISELSIEAGTELPKYQPKVKS